MIFEDKDKYSPVIMLIAVVMSQLSEQKAIKLSKRKIIAMVGCSSGSIYNWEGKKMEIARKVEKEIGFKNAKWLEKINAILSKKNLSLSEEEKNIILVRISYTKP